ncbi:putative toxin-antitoxin system toxin component, PIN family [Desulfobacter latus]|uniref:Putative toxin-antitoxin system toxin component, PIN family n=1 Tax=Desulfobacter latus TaxID=2292 RepID=A0A850TAL7_9BACT|nr:putative toxin-antitoxin system toxin component, PIN family [Desulfobacter latus]
MMRVVIDTNILVSAMKSDMGASYALISTLPSKKFDFYISVPLYLEYQDVLTRPEHMTGKNTKEEILAFLRYLCKVAEHQKIFYLWRPWLKDPKDDLVLELAVASQCEYIITYNLKDFSNIQNFGVKPIRPKEFLPIIREV